MMWVALKMLTGDRAKFFGIIFGVAFASLLMSQQMSIFLGLMKRTGSVVRDVGDGVDLWVMDKDILYIDDFKPLPDMALHRVRGMPGVKWAVPFFKGMVQVKMTTGPLAGAELREQAAGQAKELPVISQSIVMIGVDDASLLGAPREEEMVVGSVRNLLEPESVLVDRDGCSLLWHEESAALKKPEDYRRFLGRTLEINGKSVIVAGVCHVSLNFNATPTVYTTYSRVKPLFGGGQRTLTYILAKVNDNVSPEEVSRTIAERSANTLKARTPPNFTWDIIGYYFARTPIPVNFFMTVALGFLVGTAIAGQTFYTFTIENLKQFGALKAMGTSDRRILIMVLLQSFIVGPIGYSFGIALAAVFGVATAKNPSIAYYMPWQVPAITAVAVLVICVVSSLLSIRKLMVLEPAIVFRG
jgi:putative ABC transport system permease protein